MSTTFNYDTFVTRNEGYIRKETQAKIRETRLLCAGAGLGGQLILAAARLGVRRFTLVDGDTVEAHNLNRQAFYFEDIGQAKAEALKRHILRINPEAEVEAVVANLDQHNAAQLVGQADIIFDTIDFLDLDAILQLHTQAQRQARPIFTALSAGDGACVMYIPADAKASLADIIARDVGAARSEQEASYANVFGKIMARIGAHLDRQVVEQVARALTVMEDGRPCPASQLVTGALATAALAVTMMHDLLDGRAVPQAPLLVAHSYRSGGTRLVDISTDQPAH